MDIAKLIEDARNSGKDTTIKITVKKDRTEVVSVEVSDGDNALERFEGYTEEELGAMDKDELIDLKDEIEDEIDDLEDRLEQTDDADARKEIEDRLSDLEDALDDLEDRLDSLDEEEGS